MDVNRWRETAANNNAAVPDGAPENWTGSQVNDWGREQMAALYRWYQYPEWIDITFGLAAYGAKTITKLSDTSFRIASCDARTTVSGNPGYVANRRFRVVSSSVNYDGFIVSVAFTAGNTDVTVVVDGGTAIPVTIDSAYLHIGNGLAKIAFSNNPENIDDTSADAAEQDTVLSPGTYASRVLATDLEDELQMQRYAIGRLAVGVGATRNGGANAVNWIEKAAGGMSRTLNGRFVLWDGVALNAPTHWTKVGTPTTLETVLRTDALGRGREVRIVADASGEGISQAVDSKASTLYLVRVVARAAVGSPVLSTTGGTGATWGNFSAVIASAVDAEYFGVVLTDATPTDITLRALSAAAGNDFSISAFDLIELGNGPRPANDIHLGAAVSSPKNTAETIATGAWTVPSSLTSPIVYVPGAGYDVIVHANVTAAPASSSNSNAGVRIEQSIGGGAWTQVNRPKGLWSNDTDRAASASVSYVDSNATIGSHQYRVAVQAVAQSYIVSPSVATLGQLGSEITVEVRYRG